MITGAIAVVFGIAAIVSASEGEWGPFWIGVAIIVVLLMFGSAWRDGDKAVNNFVDYWKDGGPEKERRRE